MYNGYTNDLYSVSKSFSKITFFNIVNTILLVFVIGLGIATSVSLNKYGLAIQNSSLMPAGENSTRAWFLFFLILYFFINSFVIENAIFYIKQTREKPLAILSCICPLFFIICIFKGIHYSYFKQYWYYLVTDRNESEQISHIEVFMWMRGQCSFSKLAKNTLLFYFTLLLFTVGIGFILSDHNDGLVINDYFIFNTVSYFTQQNNFMCWVFLMLFIFFNRKTLFSNNTWLQYMTGYILIVSIVAIIMVGPYVTLNPNSGQFDCAYSIAKFIWLHVVNPIFFTWFAFSSMAQTYTNPITFKSYILNFLRYPLFYGIYLYSLPFLCCYSVYGQLTNLNPHMIEEQASGPGQPAWCLAIILITAFIFFIGWLVRHISIKLVYSYQTFKR